jgi:ribosomal protein S18 acetylase RimI-like enzyme
MADEFTLKILSESNLHLLINTQEGIFDNLVDEKLTREFLADPRHHIVVALFEDTIIGFASAVHYVHPDKPTELWINEVGVAPAHQNKGVGKAIMRELLQLGQSLGCVNAWVLTDRSNTPANRLYKSAGGEVDPGDTVVYEFDLKGE